MSASSQDVVLNQNLVLLTNAVIALNDNMFDTTGGRPGIFGAAGAASGQRPGQGVNSIKDPHVDMVKQTAATLLLNKTLQDHKSAVNYFVKNQTQNIKDINQFTTAAGQLFSKSLDKLSAQQLQETPKKLTQFLQDKIGAGLVKPLESLDDVIRLNTRTQTANIDAAQSYYEQFLKLNPAQANYIKAVEDVADKMEKIGFSIDEAGELARDGGKGFADMRDQAKKIQPAMAEYTLSQEAATMATGKWTKALEIGTAVLGAYVKMNYQAATAAAKFGTEISSSTIFRAMQAGLTPEELIKTQHDQVQAIRSSGVTFDQFNNTVARGAWNLLQFTGNLGDGAKLTASFLGTFRSLSNNTDMQNGFMEQQANLFGRMNREFGETAEQFAAFNANLVNNNALQTQLFKINQNQRVALVQGLQLAYERLRIDGLTEEQAKKVVDALAQLSGETTLTRLQQGAQAQGILGALGVRNAAEIGRGIRQGTLSEEQVAGVNKQLSQNFQNNPQGRIQQEQLLQILQKNTGLNLFGPGTAGGALATAQGRATDPEQHKANDYMGNHMGSDITKVSTELMGIYQVSQTGAKDILAGIHQLAELWIGTKLISAVLMAGRGGGIGGAGGFGGAAGGAASSAGRLARGLKIGGVGALLAGGLDYAATGNAGEAISTGAGGLVGGILGSFLDPFLGPFGTILGSAAGSALGGWIGSKFGTGSTGGPDQSLVDQLQQQEDAYKAAGDTEGANAIETRLVEIKDQMAKVQKNLDDNSPLSKTMKALHLEVKKGNDLAAAQRDDQIKQTKKVVEKTNDHLYRPPTKQ